MATRNRTGPADAVRHLVVVMLWACLATIAAPGRAGVAAERLVADPPRTDGQAHPGLQTRGPIRIVALGDSLTAGLGLPEPATFPVKLQKALTASGHAVEIANAGVSGDTASDGLARLAWSVPEGTDAVILELGANDALRGIDPKVTRAALETIIQRLRQQHVAILLAGMRAPPNMGGDYAQAFESIFSTLATRYDLIFFPFFLDGVAANPALNQPDGMHPTAAGVDVIVANILPAAEQLIGRVNQARQP